MASEASASPSPAQLSPRWSIQLPVTDPVAFRGQPNFDGAGVGTGPMSYPAPNAAGFLAAVIVHGLINESVKREQKNKLQQEADRVLEPYRTVLARLTHAELARGAQAMPEAQGEAWQIESVPVFTMTQDQAALVLDNAVSVRRTGSAAPAYQSVIRVVSIPLSDAEPAAYWSRDDGAMLRQVTSLLMRESMELAVAMAAKPTPEGSGMAKTFRYLEGKAERVERATLVSEGCMRRVLLTLRETLLSVPFAADSDACRAGVKKTADN